MKKFFVTALIGFFSFIYITFFHGQIIFATTSISNVSVINIMGSGAQITWTTDTPSNSNVYYGTSSGSYPLTSSMRCDSGGMVISHCVNLMYLSPSTAYYYKVSSTDETSSNSVSEGYQFISAGDTTTTTTASSSSNSPASGGGGGGGTTSSQSSSYTSTTMLTAPSNLSATLTYPNSVNLSWVDNSSNETRFEIYRRLLGGTWSFLTSRDSGLLAYSDTGLSPGTYEYTISACNSYGCSTAVYSSSVIVSSTTTTTSSSSSVTTTTTMPTAPSSFNATLAYPNSVNLSWVDNSSNETRFDIYRRTTSGTWTLAASKSSGYTSHYETGLSPGTYEYTISACNSYGCSTAVYSSSVIVSSTTTTTSSSSSVTTTTTSSSSSSSSVITTTTTSSIPSAPSKVYAVLIYANNVNISWLDNSSNETYFEIYRRPSGGTWNKLSPVSYSPYYDTGLAVGTYEYLVMACNSYGCSMPIYSSIVTISSTAITSSGSSSSSSIITTSAQIPSAPSNLSVLLTYPNSVNISWSDNSSNETRFDIYRRTTSGTWTLAASKSSGYTSHYETGLSAGTYEYFITACNSYGCSVAVYSTGVLVSSTAPAAVSSSSSSIAATQTFVAAISGTVSDSFGRTVPGSFIYITPKTLLDSAAAQQSYSITTDSLGAFRVYLPAGKYTIETFPPSGQNYLKPTSLEVALSSGETRNLYINYPAGAKTLRGSALFGSGKPIVDAEIGAYRRENGQWIRTFTDTLGKFEVNLSGGTWEISIYPRSGQIAKWEAQLPHPTIMFANDSLAEVKTVNLYANNLESEINVRVADSAGSPVSGVGVVIDTVSAMNTTSYSADLERQMKFMKTGTDGFSKFYAPAGTYYIRVYVPEGSGATVPSEEKIVLNNEEIKSVAINLKQENISNTVNVQGETKLDDGTLTNAFVWAWSEKGGYEKTNSSMYGDFSLMLAKGQKWHIGAGKDSTLGYYKSSEIIIDSGESAVPQSLTLSKYGTETLPVSVVVGGKATEQIIAEGDDGVRFSLPASSVKDSGQISVEVKPTAEAPSQAASTIVSKVYDISVTNSFGNNISTLSSEAEVTIPYDEAELKNKGVSVESVIPSYFDESSGAWVAVSNYTIDKAKKVVILRINHLTRFALIAAADTTPPLSPSSVSASVISNLQGKSPGKVKISWTNPLKDIDHSKVYRSDEFGKIGKVLATVVISNSFMDESEFVDGKPYYYTVRSVDSAGNESNNTDQVSINMTGGLSRLAASNSQTFLLPPGQAISGSISRNLKAGSSGDDVKTLQRILISEDVYPEAVISGYFGRLTKNAVIKFQEKYFDEILAPGGFKQGTGYAGIASRKKLNEILGRQTSSSSVSQASKSNNSGLIVNSLTIGSAGEEVKILQNILIKEGVYADGKITGIYDSSTKEAVKLLQEKYASEILTPIGLSEGTGFLGAATRKKLNELISQ